MPRRVKSSVLSLCVQVEDVDNKFVALSKLRSNGWVQEQLEKPKKKNVSKVMPPHGSYTCWKYSNLIITIPGLGHTGMSS